MTHLLDLPQDVLQAIFCNDTTNQCAKINLLSTCRTLYSNDTLWLHLIYLETESQNRLLLPFKEKHKKSQALILSTLRVKNIPVVGNRVKALEVAAGSGNLELVECFLTQTASAATAASSMSEQYLIPSTMTFDAAAANGHLDVVKLLWQNSVEGSCEALNSACANGQLEIVQWLHSNGFQCTQKAMDSAATNGFLEIVQFLHENRSEGCSQNAVNGAAENNHLSILKYMHSVGLLEGPPYACSNWALEAAALNGSLPVLEWLHENVALFSAENSKKISLKSAIDGAAGRGHLHVVQWLHCNRRDGASTWAVDRAAGSGYLDILQWLLEHRSEGGTTQAATLASLNGHLHVLQWLHKNTEIAINSSETYQNSIRGGHIHVLEYLYSLQKSNEPANLLETACTHNRFEIIQFLFLQHPNLTISPNALKNAFRSQNTTLFLDLFEKATKQQQLETLLQERTFLPIFTELWNIVGTTGSQASFQLLKSLQIPGISNSEVLTKAAENGQLELVRELIYTEKMTAPDPMSLRAAAANGHLRIVKLLSPLIQDIAANEMAIVEAARHGYLKIVEWLDRNIALEFRSNHVYSLISVVAEYGFLDIVQFLHVHKGAVCITRAMDRAAMSNHLHIIKYLTEICGATCSQWALNYSAKYGYLHIVKYLVKHHRTECDTIAFRYAVESGRINVVRFFLENEFVWEVGRNGDLVDLAVKNWHWKVQRLLVDHGF